MRLESDSYYIDYMVKSDNKEYASIMHFINVWDNGYISDTYGFEQNWMDFEDAIWTGVSIDDRNKGKRIDKQLYNNWVKRVTDCRNRIVEMADNTSSEKKEVRVGDYLYNARNVKDDYRYWLLHITEISADSIMGATVYIDRYDIINHPEPEHLEQYGIIDQSRRITKEVFDLASELIAKTSEEILEEIKKQFQCLTRR